MLAHGPVIHLKIMRGAEHEGGKGLGEGIRRRPPLRLERLRRYLGDVERLLEYFLEDVDRLALAHCFGTTDRNGGVARGGARDTLRRQLGDISGRHIAQPGVAPADDLRLPRRDVQADNETAPRY